MFIQLLTQLGHQPTKTTSKSVTYRSPFNPQEKTPSFLLFKNKKWDGVDQLKELNFKDNSSGIGGDIYKFMMEYEHINFRTAKKRLGELLGLFGTDTTQSYTKPQTSHFKPTTEPTDTYKIKKLSPLSNKALVDYLQDRKISLAVAEKYISEVCYTLGNKNYFALAFYNNSGGMEVRNKYFKGSFLKKDYSTVAPFPKQKNLKWFEGFLDFLSYIEINEFLPTSDYIVLNTLSLTQRALNALQYKYDTHELYLDNDKAGDKATNEIIEFFGNQGVEDKRCNYQEFKDLNEYRCSKNSNI